MAMARLVTDCRLTAQSPISPSSSVCPTGSDFFGPSQIMLFRRGVKSFLFVTYSLIPLKLMPKLLVNKKRKEGGGKREPAWKVWLGYFSSMCQVFQHRTRAHFNPTFLDFTHTTVQWLKVLNYLRVKKLTFLLQVGRYVSNKMYCACCTNTKLALL